MKNPWIKYGCRHKTNVFYKRRINMVYFQIADGGVIPNWENLFSDYDNKSLAFGAAIEKEPQKVSRGNFQNGNEVKIGPDEWTAFDQQPGCGATVAPLNTCTALIARCGESSEILAYHLKGGDVSGNAVNELNRLRSSWSSEQAQAQAIYVIPHYEDIESYKEDVEKLQKVGYQVCFIVPSEGKPITMVRVDGDGTISMA
jgi:hypothetical protein